ncbi:bombyxin A-3 homolog [Bicyclus anynana]|uniref:Bombyxin A-3 homolog n=1 Tax=Bicyclus anynana TaxID=110368 RepID=A0ABM3M5Q9_BICAN|nr:bombyxin A-3 homolog [Bicyclus anynana]
MKTHTVLLLLACMGLASVVTSQSIYCGRRLAMALDLVCDGHLIKRSEVKREPAVELQWPWIDEQHALGGGFRRKRLVVEECCDKPCTVDELMTYCH